MRRLLCSIAVLSLTACGGTKEDAPAADPALTTSATPATAANAAPAAFMQCKVCHAVTPGTNGVGPSLAGVAGRKAGTLAGFAYSEAMKGSGLTWDDATLDTYITAPAKTVPGTRMSYAGMTDAAKRAELIGYLKTLK